MCGVLVEFLHKWHVSVSRLLANLRSYVFAVLLSYMPTRCIRRGAVFPQQRPCLHHV